MNSKTQHRRASDRHGENGTGAAPSVIEILVNTLTDRIARSAMLRMKRGVHDTVRWTALRLILGGTGAALLSGGLLLLLGAGVLGLQALQCPLWLAFLLTGVFTLLIALVAMKGILWPKERDRKDD